MSKPPSSASSLNNEPLQLLYSSNNNHIIIRDEREKIERAKGKEWKMVSKGRKSATVLLWIIKLLFGTCWVIRKGNLVINKGDQLDSYTLSLDILIIIIIVIIFHSLYQCSDNRPIRIQRKKTLDFFSACECQLCVCNCCTFKAIWSAVRETCWLLKS